MLHDDLRVETGLVTAQRIRAQWAQVAWRDGELIASQRINFATVSLSGRPKRIPAELLDAMNRFFVGESWCAKGLPDLAL